MSTAPQPSRTALILEEIRNQLLNDLEDERYQCLAYLRCEGKRYKPRCQESCRGFGTVYLKDCFRAAQNALKGKNIATSKDDFKIILRILFCSGHSRKDAFERQLNLLKLDWNGDNNPKEEQLLEAFRQAYIPLTGTGPYQDFDSSIFSRRSGTPFSEIAGGDGESSINVPISPQPTTSLASNPPSPKQRSSLLSSLSSSSIFGRDNSLPLRPAFQHARNLSNTTRQSSARKAGNTHNTQRTNRLAQNTQPLPDPSQHARLTNSQFSFGTTLPQRTSALREFADAERRSATSSWTTPTSFSSSDWQGKHDWNKFLNPAIPMRSRDDTFLDLMSRSAAADTPSLFDASPRTPNPAQEEEDTAATKNKIYEPFVIDNHIHDAIRRNVTKEGFVYILKAPEYFKKHFPNEPARVKIGMSTNVKERVSELKKSCKMDDLSEVHNSQKIPTGLYYKIEILVRSELGNFQRKLECMTCKQEHKEWFQVPEDVALASVQRWTKFILQDPYNGEGILKDHWCNMIAMRNMMHPSKTEEWEDHQNRTRRWDEWLEKGIATAPKE